jgi:hypothetical protein
VTHPDRGHIGRTDCAPRRKAAAQNDQVSAAHVQIINQLQAEQNGGYRAMAATGHCRHNVTVLPESDSLPSTGCVPITSLAAPGGRRTAGSSAAHGTVLAGELTCRVRPDKPNSVELCFSTQFRVVPPVMTCVNSSTRARGRYLDPIWLRGPP